MNLFWIMLHFTQKLMTGIKLFLMVKPWLLLDYYSKNKTEQISFSIKMYTIGFQMGFKSLSEFCIIFCQFQSGPSGKFASRTVEIWLSFPSYEKFRFTSSLVCLKLKVSVAFNQLLSKFYHSIFVIQFMSYETYKTNSYCVCGRQCSGSVIQCIYLRLVERC